MCFRNLIYFIFSIILFFGFLFFLSLGLLGKEAEGIITNVYKKEVHVTRKGRAVEVKKNGYWQPKTRIEFHFDYDFVVDGKKYSGTGQERKFIHDKNSKITVYYLPQYPKFNTVISKNYCYLIAAFLLFLAILLMKSCVSGRRAKIEIGNDLLDFGPKYPKGASLPVNNQTSVQTANQVVQPVAQPVQQVVQPQQTSANTKGYAFCPKCGSPLGNDYAFCPKCGCKF